MERRQARIALPSASGKGPWEHASRRGGDLRTSVYLRQPFTHKKSAFSTQHHQVDHNISATKKAAVDTNNIKHELPPPVSAVVLPGQPPAVGTVRPVVPLVKSIILLP